ncbi:hypothetical protein CN326_21500 [Bacillus sp. AFS018417]|uniref:hypothetical protein n=1 Tax=Bacillus sp. AFS018417 TaxID=2033491 RepID=UPI000BF51281|nr:hypothetical protein [Bacillus sp. AFS018417]PEZ01333.1 hypothetical protein CN326_21500 [Bacillus sp. AFS018417]
MLPTREQLIQYLSDKMTNKDIANIYGTTFQKIIQLIKKYKLNPNELRKVNKFIVYEHWLNGEVVYAGSGVWYRCRRYTNRVNLEHRKLMQEGKLNYRFIEEFDSVKEARQYEAQLIKKYKKQGLCRFNKRMF